jgi:hypothetical protein
MPATDGATSGPSDDQARPAPAASLSRTRAAIAVATGAIGLSCTALLVFDLFAGIRGGLPLIETLIVTVAFATCCLVGPGRLRRAAAGSLESCAVVVAVVAVFIAPATAPTHKGALTAGSSPHVPRCPIPAKASALRKPTAPEPGDRSSATLGQATIEGAGSYDGRPGIGPRMVVCIVVRRQPLTDRQLWLVVRLDLRRAIGHDLYFPKAELQSGAGVRRVIILARCPSQLTLAGVGDVRTLMVVSADSAASRTLQENYNADQACDPGWDNNPLRWHLPPGAKVISNQADVTRTR